MVESCENKFERWRRKGDTDALADVFDAIAPRLLRLAIHLVGDVAAAEDLVQSTFVTAIEDASTWDPSRPLEPWLTGILDNRAKRLLKSRERPIDRAAREGIDHDTPLTRAMESETSTEITKAIDQLDEPYRSVMVLSMLHHLEPAAIAHALDRSPGAVRVQLHRGREMVRKLLPAGVLTSAALLASSGRGLAAIKSAVLAHSGGAIAVHVSATTGVLIMTNKLSLLLVALVFLVGGVVLVARLRMPESTSSSNAASVLDAEESRHAAKEAGLTREVAGVDSRKSLQPDPDKLVITGRVLNAPVGDASGPSTPASGCHVSIKVQASTANPPPARTSETDADEHGNFRFEMESPTWPFVGVYLKAPADDGFCIATRYSAGKSGMTSLEGQDLVRAVRNPLRGIVLDEHDAPLAGIPVELIDETDRNVEPVRAETDASGRFEMRPEAIYRAYFSAELGGSVMFGNVSAERDYEHGTWKEAVIVLARRGRLRIHLQNSVGDPLPAQDVHVDADFNEPRRSKEQFSFRYAIGFDVYTDASGTATFDALWVGKRLRIEIREAPGKSPNMSSSASMQDGRLLFAKDPQGEAIVIGPSGMLDLVAQYDPDIVVRGVVLRSDRTPVPLAFVEARDGSNPSFGVRYPVGSARADSQGRFELHVNGNAGLTRLRINAAELAWRNEVAWKNDIEPLGCAGTLLLDVDRVDPKRVVEVPLVDLQHITGRVSDKSGAPIWATVSAVSAGSALVAEENCIGRPAIVSNAPDGNFRLDNVPPGRYDLVVQRVGGFRDTFPLAMQRYPDVDAGSDVNLVFDRELEARVHVRVVSKYGNVKFIQVLRDRRVPNDPSTPRVLDLPAEITVHSFADWPRYVSLAYGDVRRATSPDYRDDYTMDDGRTPEMDLPAMGESWGFLVGVRARLADGRECFPMSTGLVHIGPGEHTVTFDVVPTRFVDGHVTGMPIRPSDEIALVDERGRLLPQGGSNNRPTPLLPSVGLRDDGWFRFEGAPLGEFRVRIGSRRQLEHGEFQFERKVEIAESRPPLEIDVRGEATVPRQDH